MSADEASADMKKHPTDGARARRQAMTDAERRIWRMLRARQIDRFRFRRQVPIGRYIADFFCHEARSIIEIDGGQHDAASPLEVERSRFLESQGYKMLWFWNNEVLANPEGVFTIISGVLASAAPPPSPPPSWGRV